MRDFRVTTERKPHKRGWDYTIVSIFEGDQFLGSYERRYPAFGESTFYPFEQEGSWYALYSADYTCTRLMSLPECRDIGGEEPRPQGFCPVEFYIPRYRKAATISDGMGRTYDTFEFDNVRRPESGDTTERAATAKQEQPMVEYGPWQFLTTGFVAGCIWGDDSSWKVEVLDLSRAAEGIVKREARFGHIELPRNGRLSDCIRFGYWEPERQIIRIVREEARSLATGALIDPYDL